MKKRKLSEEEAYELYIHNMYRERPKWPYYLALAVLMVLTCGFIYTHPEPQPMTQEELARAKADSFQSSNYNLCVGTQVRPLKTKRKR